MDRDRKRKAEILRGAVEEMEARGWSQGAWEAEDGSVCAIGACAVAAYQTTTIPLTLGAVPHVEVWVRDDLLETINEQYPEGYRVRQFPDEHGECGFSQQPWLNVMAWNDEYGRTADEVKAVFEKTAMRLEEEA